MTVNPTIIFDMAFGNGGLETDLEQFKRMKSIDRDVLIYKNVLSNKCSILKINILYVWAFILTVATGFKDYIPFLIGLSLFAL